MHHPSRKTTMDPCGMSHIQLATNALMWAGVYEIIYRRIGNKTDLETADILLGRAVEHIAAADGNRSVRTCARRLRTKRDAVARRLDAEWRRRRGW